MDSNNICMHVYRLRIGLLPKDSRMMDHKRSLYVGDLIRGIWEGDCPGTSSPSPTNYSVGIIPISIVWHYLIT